MWKVSTPQKEKKRKCRSESVAEIRVHEKKMNQRNTCMYLLVGVPTCAVVVQFRTTICFGVKFCLLDAVRVLCYRSVSVSGGILSSRKDKQIAL